ncbi:hypothetical protein SRABI106_03975 [Rahnella aquatilis]|nr:hypothetical protein SRABI106_03975 [Rahnella aquatilis]
MRTAGNHFVAAFQNYSHHCLCVFSHLLLVSFELRFHRFFQCYRFTGNHVHQRAALTTREDSRVQFFVELFVAAFRQNQTAAWASQRFVRGGGHDVCVWNRVRVNARSNQTGNVCHVNEEVSANAVGDFTHFCPVNDTGECREAADDHFWFVQFGLTFHVFVIDVAAFVDTIRHHVIQFTGKVNR